MANVDEFLVGARGSDLPRVQRVLADGDVSITDADINGSTVLLYAAHGGPRSLLTLKWLLEEGGARITERDRGGYTVLLQAAGSGNFTACQWLLEHGGADIGETNAAGETIWDMLADRPWLRPAEVTALLRHGAAGLPSGRLRGSAETTRARAGGGEGSLAEGGPPCVPRAAAGPPGGSLPLDPAPPSPGPRIRSGAHHHGGALGHGARRGSLIHHLRPRHACVAVRFSITSLIPSITAAAPQHLTPEAATTHHEGNYNCIVILLRVRIGSRCSALPGILLLRYVYCAWPNQASIRLHEI
jgi:hypothetical protein